MLKTSLSQAPTSQSLLPTGVVLACLLVMAVMVSLTNGAVELTFSNLFKHQEYNLEQAVLWTIRLPRIVLCILVGGGLAYAGAAIQGLFRNPLAEPGLIGVASGSALGVGVFIVLIADTLPGYWGLYGMSLFAFAGACLASLLVLHIVQKLNYASVMALLLVGLAFNAIASAGSGLLTYFSNDEQIRTMAFWSIGSLGRSEWTNVLVTSSLMLPAMLWLNRFAQPLNLMQLGEREMEYTGIDSRHIKRNIILGTAVLVGSAVAAAGIIGFVGLLIPHLIRLLVGANHRVVLPLSFLAGGLLVVAADTLARTLIAPSEIPVGILTSLLGGPFFLWLLCKQFNSINK